MNYFIEENNQKVYVRRQFGHADYEKIFTIDLTTHKIKHSYDGNPDLPDLTDDELRDLHAVCAQNYVGNEQVTKEVEEEILFRKHLTEYKVPVLRCRNGVWSYEMVGDDE